MLFSLYFLWAIVQRQTSPCTTVQKPVTDDDRYAALHNQELSGGDMILPQNYLLKNGILDEAFRWPGYPGGAEIPYVIHKDLTNSTDLILQAMDAYHNTTCIRFVPRTTQKDYLNIFMGPGCFSVVGRDSAGTQPQPLSLARGCLFTGTIIHELGHAIGFYHEQNRSDRDEFITIHDENVPSKQKHNFRKLPTSENLLLTPFDYDSIMIYGNYAFSKRPFEDMTMEAKNGQQLLEPYMKTGMTLSDIERVQKLYKCI